jgi:hypothetical protein
MLFLVSYVLRALLGNRIWRELMSLKEILAQHPFWVWSTIALVSALLGVAGGQIIAWPDKKGWWTAKASAIVGFGASVIAGLLLQILTENQTLLSIEILITAAAAAVLGPVLYLAVRALAKRLQS